MKMHKNFKLAIGILIIQLIIVLWLGYNLAPETQIPVHWNIHNQIDGYASRDAAIIPFWLFNLGLFLIMMFSEKLSPVFKQNKERYNAIIPLMSLGLVFFFAVFHIYMLLLGRYPEWQDKTSVVYLLIGALFIFLGNIMPKLPRNFIAGIKTPWTFYSDEIWRKTSRTGGYCFAVFGLSMLIRGALDINTAWMNTIQIILLIALIGYPVLYSFWLYQRSRKEEG